MTISAYQVDNVIKAYNKQSKSRMRVDVPQVSSTDRFSDVVCLSRSEDIRTDAYKKISYSLLDVIVKDKR